MAGKGPTRGASYAESVRAGYELNESQDVLVDEIASTLDIIDRLDPLADEQELRAQRVVLLRALGALALPDAGDTSGKRPTVGRLRAAKAAQSRWAAG